MALQAKRLSDDKTKDNALQCDDLHEWCQKYGFDKYHDAFIDKGIETVNDIIQSSMDDLIELCGELQFTHNERDRFLNIIIKSNENNELSVWCKENKLDKYYDLLIENNYFSPKQIGKLSSKKVNKLCKELGIKYGDKKRFENSLRKIRENKEIIDIKDRKIIYVKHDKNNNNDTSPNRTILMVGETGTGKTTTINSMMNYLYDAPFEGNRYKLIQEIFDDKKVTDSQTDEISVYYLKPPAINYTLTIIDTPGFGNCDIKGIEFDQEITNKLQDLFKTKITQIDGICFLIKANQNCLTDRQQYIFNETLNVFGKNLKNNIIFLFTFDDGSKTPLGLEVVKSMKIPYRDKYFTYNNNGFKLDLNEENRDNFDKGMETFGDFFEELTKIKKQSLKLSQQVLDERKQLKFEIKCVQQRLNDGKSICQSIMSKEEINKNDDEMIKLKQIERDLGESVAKIRKCIDKIKKIALNKIMFTPNQLDMFMQDQDDQKDRMNTLKTLKEQHILIECIEKSAETDNIDSIFPVLKKIRMDVDSKLGIRKKRKDPPSVEFDPGSKKKSKKAKVGEKTVEKQAAIGKTLDDNLLTPSKEQTQTLRDENKKLQNKFKKKDEKQNQQRKSEWESKERKYQQEINRYNKTMKLQQFAEKENKWKQEKEKYENTKQELKKTKTKTNKLQQQLKKSKDEKEAINKELMDQKNIHQNEVNEIANTNKSKLAALKSDNDKLKADVAAKNDQLTEHREEINELRSDISVQKANTDRLSNKCKALEEKVAALKTSEDNIKKKHEILKQTQMALEANLSTLKDENNKTKELKAQQFAEYENTKKELKQTKSKENELQQQLQEFKDTNNSKLTALQSDNDKLKVDIAAKNDQFTKNQEEMSQLQSYIAVEKANNDRLDNKCKALEDQVAALKISEHNIKKKYEILKDKSNKTIQLKDEQFAEKENEWKQEKKEYSKIKRRAIKLEQQLKEKKDENETGNEKIKCLQQEIEKLKTEKKQQFKVLAEEKKLEPNIAVISYKLTSKQIVLNNHSLLEFDDDNNNMIDSFDNVRLLFYEKKWKNIGIKGKGKLIIYYNKSSNLKYLVFEQMQQILSFQPIDDKHFHIEQKQKKCANWTASDWCLKGYHYPFIARFKNDNDSLLFIKCFNKINDNKQEIKSNDIHNINNTLKSNAINDDEKVKSNTITITNQINQELNVQKTLIWNQEHKKWNKMCKRSTIKIYQNNNDEMMVIIKDSKSDKVYFNHIIPNKQDSCFKNIDEKLSCRWIAKNDSIQQRKVCVFVTFQSKQEFEIFTNLFQNISR